MWRWPLTQGKLYTSNFTLLHTDLQKKLSKVDTKFREQALELNGMKKRLCEAEAKQQQCFTCNEKLEQQHKELLLHQKKILCHVSKVHVHVYAKDSHVRTAVKWIVS